MRKQETFVDALEQGVLDHSLPQVYFIRSGDYTKIGMTTGSVKKRIDTLKVGNPHAMTLLFTVLAYTKDAARTIEARYHKLFAHKRVQGEWFNLTEADLNQAWQL